jgi:hypothetical protein
MIRFRQKEFAWPALAAIGNAAMIGGTAWSLKQGSDQAKQAERHQQEALEEQRRENAKLTKALDNIAKEAANNPQAAAAASELVRKNKTFSSPAVSRFLKNAGQVAKDAVGAVGSGKNGKGVGKIGKTLIGMGTAGATITGASYLVDKAISHDARKIGMMPKKGRTEQKSYSAASIMSKTGNYLRKGVKYTFSKKNLLNKGNLITAGVIGAVPAVGYMASRAQYKDQIKNTAPEQKAYAAPAAVGTKLTSGLASFMSFGKFGGKKIAEYGSRLSKNKNKWSKTVGKWIVDNPNKANLAGAAVGAGVVSGAMSAGEKLTKKALNKVDKNAFSYEKHQNQQVN